MNAMKITWDKKARAAYIYLTNNEKVKVSRTQPISGDVSLDFTTDALVGIEILNTDKPIIECIGQNNKNGIVPFWLVR